MPPRPLEWKERTVVGQFSRFECSIAGADFLLRLFGNSDIGYTVRIITDSGTLYMSKRTYPLEQAKQFAVRAGLRVARREAQRHTEIAEFLEKHKEVARRK